jgi:hypothetical protein
MNNFIESQDDYDFFFYCVSNEKTYFLKYALRNKYFPDDFPKKNQIIHFVIDKLKEGINIQFMLNILLYADFKEWDY